MKTRLTSGRLELRPLDPAEDLDAIHRLWTNAEVRRYLWDDEIISRDLAAETLERSAALHNGGEVGIWGMRRRDEHELIGFCGFYPFFEPPRLQLIGGLTPEYWGRGYATEAGRAMLRYVFEDLGWTRVLAATDLPNRASDRAMQRLGMRFVESFRHAGLDTVVYSITREHLA